MDRRLFRLKRLGYETSHELVKRLHELAQQHPRYGYRRITAKLNAEHWAVNCKRVQRLWRAEGLKVVTTTHKRTRLGDGENACHRRKPEHAHHVWALDLIIPEPYLRGLMSADYGSFKEKLYDAASGLTGTTTPSTVLQVRGRTSRSSRPSSIFMRAKSQRRASRTPTGIPWCA